MLLVLVVVKVKLVHCALIVSGFSRHQSFGTGSGYWLMMIVLVSNCCLFHL